MNIKAYIEQGEKIAGSQVKLAQILGQTPSRLRDAKGGRCGLPVAVCFQLAELIGEDERRVVAASELVTEKKAERRAVLLPFVGHALSAMIAVVILNMTPTPANALPARVSSPEHCILCQIREMQLSGGLGTFTFMDQYGFSPTQFPAGWYWQTQICSLLLSQTA